ncbi:response regulator [Deinococcus cellulosilyticus]|uniref:Response regulatory domain-containing protein n=1 Tax=Deinococcus cellulosilyticus (strain DSM 18568 / NBRC 106333 / KACC 11606 / 5516J-15) TaxID=1223518 RepID=A0A511N3X9_DEIC1|nr:response regulator [Deinococcus cellulosilyticus]GEM47116.1 hypothetical protein DC3_27510 [Deinococcus cellulosilyticus NBRC 106333 = KACC 11606]
MNIPNPKVLVIEDDGTVRRMLVRFLRLNRYLVKDATDFEEAMQAIEEDQCFDVILLDVNFPGGGGLELLPHLKQKCSDATVIVVSATEDLNVVSQLMEDGAADFVAKPFDVTQLLEHIERHLHAHS